MNDKETTKSCSSKTHQEEDEQSSTGVSDDGPLPSLRGNPAAEVVPPPVHAHGNDVGQGQEREEHEGTEGHPDQALVEGDVVHDARRRQGPRDVLLRRRA